MSSAALSSSESSSQPRTSLPPGSVVQDKLAVPSAEAGEALCFGLRLRLPFLSSVARSLARSPATPNELHAGRAAIVYQHVDFLAFTAFRSRR
jgi:hypothetical protein